MRGIKSTRKNREAPFHVTPFFKSNLITREIPREWYFPVEEHVNGNRPLSTSVASKFYDVKNCHEEYGDVKGIDNTQSTFNQFKNKRVRSNYVSQKPKQGNEFPDKRNEAYYSNK